MINRNSKTEAMLNNVSLEQNKPNPFNKLTIISYILPLKYSNAQIVITDESGKIVRRVNVSGVGKGTLNINGGNLSPGAYNYTLVVDSQMVSSKQMILGK